MKCGLARWLLRMIVSMKTHQTKAVSEYMRQLQIKATAARCANETPEERKERMSKLARRLWAKRKAIKPNQNQTNHAKH